MSLLPSFEPGQFIKPSINVGAGFDILNGTYYVGMNGEEILSGGLSYIMGFAGKGNLFKSTMLNWMNFTAMYRIAGSAGNMYDTEMNIREERVRMILDNIGDPNDNPLDNGRLVITDKEKYSGNKWFEKFKEWMAEKKKDKKNMVLTPFVDRDGVTNFKMLVPTFTIIDSFSQFDTDDVDTARAKSELGDKDQNILNMRLGLVKNNFMIEMPRVTVGANNYMSLVAQIGKNMDLGASPHAPPRQQLKHLPSTEALKGVTAQFTFATHDCWLCESSKPLLEKESKEPMFPRDSSDNTRLDPDLTLVSLKQLRSKNGQSGVYHEVICSQAEGVLGTLTEYYYLKERKSWGMENGTARYSMYMSIYPEVAITRPTIRGLIASDERLCRAINITIEMKQMEEHWPHLDETGLLCEPKQLYEDIKAKGYDWNVLLDTRGWWTIGEHPIPFLSTMDLLKMRKGTYHPYWYDKLVGKEEAAKIINKAPPYVPTTRVKS